MRQDWRPRFSLWNLLLFTAAIAVSIRVGYLVGFEHGRAIGLQEAPVRSWPAETFLDAPTESQPPDDRQAR